MSDPAINWPEKPLGDLFDLARRPLTPGAYPKEEFAHYSIPAWDEQRGPAIETGASIGSTKIAITQPTILVSKLNPRIPRVVHLENPYGLRYCASTEFMLYVAKSDSVVLRFYRWFFESHLFHRKLERIATGSTNSHKRARPGETLGWSVPCPLPGDQKSVASVLDTVDEAIAKTEAVIAKLRQVRAGLLHDLLTRGLDKHGYLRDPSVHPEQFQDSALGRIPREWKVKPLDDIVASAVDGPFGSNLKTQHYVNQPGVRVVRLQNIGTGSFDDTDKAFISDEHATTLQRHQALSGDLLVASMGDANHPLARACLYPRESGPGIVKADCFRLRMKPGMAVNGYVMHFLNCPSTRRDVNLLGQGVTRDRVNLTTLLTLRVVCPPLDEQEEIMKRVEALDRAAACEMEAHGKLALLKSGLMADLLTGRVQVPETVEVRR